jgi:hypothetical protein
MIPVRCQYCGWKAEDPWDESPEGFSIIDGECLCDECRLTWYPPLVVAGNPSDSPCATTREE